MTQNRGQCLSRSWQPGRVYSVHQQDGTSGTWVEALELGRVHLPSAAYIGIPKCLISPPKGRRAADLLQQLALLLGQGQRYKAKALDVKARMHSLAIFKATSISACTSHEM